MGSAAYAAFELEIMVCGYGSTGTESMGIVVGREDAGERSQRHALLPAQSFS